MRPVPANKLQAHLNHVQNESLSPGSGTHHSAVGNLVEVYDQEKLRSAAVDVQLQREIKANPGLLFAKVKLDDGREYILPFKEPEDQVYLTYGNGVMMEGRRVRVEWTGMSISSGQIILTRSHAEQQVSIPEVSNVLDIGNII